MVGEERIGELDLGLPFDDQMTNASATEEAPDFIAQDPQSIAVALPVVQVRRKIIPGGRVRAEAAERRHYAPVAMHRAEFGQMIRPQAFSAYAGGLEMVHRPVKKLFQHEVPARESGRKPIRSCDTYVCNGAWPCENSSYRRARRKDLLAKSSNRRVTRHPGRPAQD